MKVLGISAIVADSVARLYYRNSIAFGIPIFSVDGISRMVEEEDEMEIVMGTDRVTFRNVTKGGETTASPIPDVMAKVLEAGGVYPLLKQRLAGGT
jgi:3-isopropylmalate/(R)-2-methylmalate dehydratase small subunit